MGISTPEIAPGNHQAVGCGKYVVDMLKGAGTLDFGDNERVVPKRGGGFAHRLDIFCRFHKRLADRVNALLAGKLQALVVALGEGADARDQCPADSGPCASAARRPQQRGR